MAQVGFELVIFVHQLPKCLCYRHVPPHKIKILNCS